MEVATFAGINVQEPVQNTGDSRLKARFDLLWWLRTIAGVMLALFGTTVMILYISQVSKSNGDFPIWLDGDWSNRTSNAMALVAAPTSVILSFGTFLEVKWARLTGRLLMIWFLIMVAVAGYPDVAKGSFNQGDGIVLLIFMVLWSIPSYLYFFKWKA